MNNPDKNADKASTQPETAQQNSGSADVSYGANSNLTPSDVAETSAAKKIVQAHQQSGHQNGEGEESDPAQQMDESGMESPGDQQPGESADIARMGQSGDARNRND
ncbi:hypothetical protein [Deinococcus sp.]|uniref:hypothetical protein n=1 Tax=Deinococcus sp. TaxID=47478 RepID=UPI003B59CEE0